MKKFIENLYENIPEDKYFLIWLFDGSKTKTSHWFKSPQKAVELIDEYRKDNINIYCGGGLSGKDYGRGRRCRQNEIQGLIGLYADVDIKDDEAHSKANLPKNVSEAMSILKTLPHSPTVVVHSGHGLQAWWLFKEPWIFEDEDERRSAENLSKRLNYFLKGSAKRIGKKSGNPKGWDVDSVYNLDRVLRVPGTINAKGTPVPVKVIDSDYMKRYAVSDFEDLLPAIEDFDRNEVDYNQNIVEDDLKLDPRAEPPFEKFQALLSIEDRFQASWERTRKDLQDQSASSYDLSLANYSAMAQWTEQEIANLIIASRRKHNDDLKLRQDYYKRTIGIAIANAEKYMADQKLDEFKQDEVTGNNDLMTNDKRDSLLEIISSVFEIKIIQIVKYMAEPPTYKIFTENGDVNVGTVENLIQQGKLRNHLASTTGKYLPRIKRDQWDNIAQSLLRACVEIELGQEATEKGQTRIWINDYIDENYLFTLTDKHNEEEVDEMLVRKSPFEYENKVHLFLQNLRKWLKVNAMESISNKKLARRIKEIGAESKQINITTSNGRTTRNVWVLKREDYNLD